VPAWLEVHDRIRDGLGGRHPEYAAAEPTVSCRRHCPGDRGPRGRREYAIRQGRGRAAAGCGGAKRGRRETGHEASGENSDHRGPAERRVCVSDT
jgi:hypothetical protein